MRGESRAIRGLGPYNVWEVAVGLLALGIAGLVWGLFSTYAFGISAGLPVIAGAALVVAGLIVLRWDLTHRV